MMLVVALSAVLIGCGPGVAEDSGTRKESRPNVESGGGGDSGPAETGADTSGGGDDTAESGADSEETGVDAPCDRSLPWSYVAAGNYLSCGIHSDGCAECWGAGQPEDSPPWDTAGYHWTGQDLPPPASFKTLSIVGEAVDGLYSRHTCGVTNDNQALCWGSNVSGQSNVPPGDYSAVAVHPQGTFGLAVDRGIVGWGAVGDPPADAYVAIAVGAEVAGAITESRPPDIEIFGPRFAADCSKTRS